jgi:hypothetical protein
MWWVDGLVVQANFSAEDAAVSKVQLQGWELEGSGNVTFASPINPLAGVGIDVVVAGAYRAHFSEPVVVARPIIGGGSLFEYPEAGSTIELSSGDTVTYPLGTKTDVLNVHEETRMHFKTILVYEGDPSPENLTAEGDFRTRVDGDGELPIPLADYETDVVNISLSYVHPIPGIPFPPADSQYRSFVLGPVASTLAGGGPDEGFAVWISFTLG